MFKNLLVVLTLLLLTSVPASSREITEGTATVLTNNAFVTILVQVSGTDFSVSAGGGNLNGIGHAPCTTSNLCSPGQVFNISASSGQWDFSQLGGSMTIDGTQYFFVNSLFATLPNVVGNGSVAFAGGSVMIPFGDAATITLKAPFTMSGFFRGRATGILPVSLSLTGSGIATLVLTRGEFLNGTPFYVDQSLIYRFGPQADVDIKPKNINPRSGGKVPIVILSTETFDASRIDPDTVTVAGAPVDIKPNGTTASSLQDINGDGLLDLIIHINASEIQLTSFNSEAIVEGLTVDGKFFWGTDTIEVAE